MTFIKNNSNINSYFECDLTTDLTTNIKGGQKMSKSSFKKNHQGLWEKDGNVYSHIAEIRTDKCLLATLVRKDLFRSHALVIYFPETIVREEKKWMMILFSSPLF